MKEKSKPTPNDTSLYERLKARAKKIFMVWPSAYASGWLTREYKRLGGTYSGGKKKKDMSDLERWYKEEWIDVCALPEKKLCGRKKADWEDYPYCRPSIRINKKTPKTAERRDQAAMPAEEGGSKETGLARGCSSIEMMKSFRIPFFLKKMELLVTATGYTRPTIIPSSPVPAPSSPSLRQPRPGPRPATPSSVPWSNPWSTPGCRSCRR